VHGYQQKTGSEQKSQYHISPDYPAQSWPRSIGLWPLQIVAQCDHFEANAVRCHMGGCTVHLGDLLDTHVWSSGDMGMYIISYTKARRCIYGSKSMGVFRLHENMVLCTCTRNLVTLRREFSFHIYPHNVTRHSCLDITSKTPPHPPEAVTNSSYHTPIPPRPQ
jgi:hypothetical protein